MTTLSAPTYVEEGVVHYAVPNMPALVARTATLALAQATLPYVRRLAERGVARALDDDAGLARRRDGLGWRDRRCAACRGRRLLAVIAPWRG